MDDEVKLLIVEDNDDMLYLLRVVVEFSPQPIAIAGEVRDGDDGVAAWRQVRPQITVLDYQLPGTNGLDIAEQILAEDPSAPILLFSAFLDARMIARAERIGVRACVSKDQVRELPALIQQHTLAS